jgi:hypothetical protein
MFRNFADLPYDSDAALIDWANSHGLLTRGIFSPHRSESLADWREQIFTLRATAELHELVRTRSRRLKQLVQEKMSGAFRVLVPFDTTKYWEMHLDAETRARIKTPAQMVRYVIATNVRRALEKYRVALQPVWIETAGRFEMRPIPSSLLAAMWYQAADSFAANATPLERCEVCATWMVPRRAGQKYCSNACKQKAWRAQK